MLSLAGGYQLKGILRQIPSRPMTSPRLQSNRIECYDREMYHGVSAACSWGKINFAKNRFTDNCAM